MTYRHRHTDTKTESEDVHAHQKRAPHCIHSTLPNFALFALWRKIENFLEYAVFAKKFLTIIRFILGDFQKNPWSRFSLKIQKPRFWAILGLNPKKGPKWVFSRKIWLRHFSAFMTPQLHAKKLRNPWSRFWDLRVTDRRTDWQTRENP